MRSAPAPARSLDWRVHHESTLAIHFAATRRDSAMMRGARATVL